MDDQAPTTYDEVRYPGMAHIQTHPDRLATIGTLFGMQPAPVEHCRVLELGCGDGTNLISMAYGLPESRFVGVDAAGAAIADGVRTIQALSLANIRLHHLDLMDFDAVAERFDFIIAHGIYSWTPAPVRDRILEVCAQCLAAAGIAYVSYNTYPGCHLREMVREMMLYHVRGASEPGEKVAQARALLKFLAHSKEEPDLYRTILGKELEIVQERNDANLFHDDLNPLTQPVYFHQFAEHAAAHGLQYLGDAVFSEMQPENYTPATLGALQELDADIIAREQYLDFLTCRRFRRTLLCRREVTLDRDIEPRMIEHFLASSDADPGSPEPDIESPATEQFKNPKGAAIQTNQPLAKAALLLLSRSWPRAIPFAELLAAAQALTPADDHQIAGQARDTAALCHLLLLAFAAGAVELHVWAPRIETKITQRPVASQLARHQNRHGKRLTTLSHRGLELSDAMSRGLLDLLDGTHDFAALAEALAALVHAGQASITQDGSPVTDPAQVRAAIANGLPSTLKGFARSGILIG